MIIILKILRIAEQLSQVLLRRVIVVILFSSIAELLSNQLARICFRLCKLTPNYDDTKHIEIRVLQVLSIKSTRGKK